MLELNGMNIFMSVIIFLQQWLVLINIFPAIPIIESETTTKKFVVIRGNSISLPCRIPKTANSSDGSLRVDYPDYSGNPKPDFTWNFTSAERTQVTPVADAKCRIKRNDLYKTIYTKGVSCHLWVHEVRSKDVGVFTSSVCGNFEVSIIDAKPSCESELLDENSLIELHGQLKELFAAKKTCGVWGGDDDDDDKNISSNNTNKTHGTDDDDDDGGGGDDNNDENDESFIRRPVKYSNNEMLKYMYKKMEAINKSNIEIYKINCSIDYRGHGPKADPPTLFWSPTPILTSAQIDADDQHVIHGHVFVDSTFGLKFVHVCKVLAPDNDNNLGVLSGNCRIDMYSDILLDGILMELTAGDELCQELWQYVLLGFFFSSIIISIIITLSSRVRKTPMITEESFESDSLGETERRKSSAATVKSTRKPLILAPEAARSVLTSMPSALFKTWMFRSAIDVHAPPVNFKQVMKNMKTSMRHMPPSGTGMMAEHGSTSDDLSWYFVSDNPNSRNR